MLKTLRSVSMSLFLIGAACVSTFAAPHRGTTAMQTTQDEGTCVGVVTDITGESVIGASVMIKGTVTGTITDFDGNFTLDNVPMGSTLVISFIGYQTQEIVWGGADYRRCPDR